MNSGSEPRQSLDVKAFTHKAAGIDWYCELRGSGPTIVLIPSGEGDCGSLVKVANLLADEFTVLTFDMPGFSRSSAPPDFGLVTAGMLGDQIAALITSLGLAPATFYGCSSGGQAALSLVADHCDIVRNAIVHEAALMGEGDVCWPEEMAGMFAALNALDDAGVAKACAEIFRNGMNQDPRAWDDLGPQYHQRLEKNYATWVRHYTVVDHRSYSAEELSRRPIAWSVGGYTSIWAMTGNFRTARRANIELVYLRSKHFPQVCIPDELARHVRENAKPYV